MGAKGSKAKASKRRAKEPEMSKCVGCMDVVKGVPVWDQNRPLACGTDKDVFIGRLRTRAVAVCVARKRGVKRLAVEVRMLERVGKHPNIAELLYSQTSDTVAYFALEAVEPIGFDLDRLAKQYVFAKQSVPVLLTKRLINQLADALMWMHSRQVVHRDVKSENVLVTKSYDAKLIDFGIAMTLGGKEQRWVWAPKTYMAPELCAGGVPQLPSVDSWGLGVVLHQMYQHRWDVIDCSATEITMRPNRPCLVNPMAEDLKEAMLGMLQLEEARRWKLENIGKRISADEQTQADSRDSWRAPMADEADTRKWLKKYRGSAPPLTAYAAVVDSRNSHLVGKKVGELDLRNKYGATLVLMDLPANPSKEIERVLDKSPNYGTEIREGAWLYFGLPEDETTRRSDKSPDETIAELRQALFPHIGDGLGRSVNSKDGLMVFTLEFDCFSFPKHIGRKAAIGPRATGDGIFALDLRKNFGLNLAGVINSKGTETWFPGPDHEVEPGDLGLVVRCPRRDGATDPTVMDEDLADLMNFSQFNEKVGKS
jgi:serine/threonine protein kinase